jgi:hypothetical protein
MTAAIHARGSERKGPDPVADRFGSDAPETLAHSTIGRRSPRRCQPSPRSLAELGLLGVIHAPACIAGSALAVIQPAILLGWASDRIHVIYTAAVNTIVDVWNGSESWWYWGIPNTMPNTKGAKVADYSVNLATGISAFVLAADQTDYLIYVNE